MTGFSFIDAQATPWRPSTVAAGVEVKDLGSSDGQSMQLVRFAPGTSFALHTHTGSEFIYLLEGEAFQQEQRLRPGWAATAATGTVDNHFHSPTGCVFLTVYSD
jgi:quercetin dioxygenase-like cupin family protein